jgi:hypothetical protein
MAHTAISRPRHGRTYALLECITSSIAKCIGCRAGGLADKRELVKKKINVWSIAEQREGTYNG